MNRSTIRFLLPKVFRNFLFKNETTKPSSEDFLRHFFQSDKQKSIVQIGANDGVQNDPLRDYFKKPGKYQAILIEPIPFYVKKLEYLYQNRVDVKIIRAAAGSSSGQISLYFIPPELADEMNGDGPHNSWAHGQGSFDRDTVVHWIHANSFRGEIYRQNISKYEDAITSIEMAITITDTLLPAERGNLLLVLDVQGFELEALRGIDWNHPPKFIMLEDDLGNTDELLQFMAERGFSWIAGDHDKVFECPSKQESQI